MHTYIHTYLHTYIHACIYAHVYIQTYKYICICIPIRPTELDRRLVGEGVLLGFIWSHVHSLGLTWTHSDSLGLTWSHLVSLGLTWSHLVSLDTKGSCHKREKGKALATKGKRESAEGYF